MTGNNAASRRGGSNARKNEARVEVGLIKKSNAIDVVSNKHTAFAANRRVEVAQILVDQEIGPQIRGFAGIQSREGDIQLLSRRSVPNLRRKRLLPSAPLQVPKCVNRWDRLRGRDVGPRGQEVTVK